MAKPEHIPETLGDNPQPYKEIKNEKLFSDFISGCFNSPYICKDQGYEPKVYQHPDNINRQVMFGYLWAPQYGPKGQWLNIRINTFYDPKADTDKVKEDFSIFLEIPGDATDPLIFQFESELNEKWYSWLDQKRKPGQIHPTAAMYQGAETYDAGLAYLIGEPWEDFEEGLSLTFDDIFRRNDNYSPKKRDGLTRFAYAQQVCERLAKVAATVPEYLPIFLDKEAPKLLSLLEKSLKNKPAPWTVNAIEQLHGKIEKSFWNPPEAGMEPREYIIRKALLPIKNSKYELFMTSIDHENDEQGLWPGRFEVLFFFPSEIQSVFGYTEKEIEQTETKFRKFLQATHINPEDLPISDAVINNIDMILTVIQQQADQNGQTDQARCSWGFSVNEIKMHNLLELGLSRGEMLQQIVEMVAFIHSYLVEFAQNSKSTKK